MLKWLMELELKDCVKLISNMMIENGIALNDIITDIHNQGKHSSNTIKGKDFDMNKLFFVGFL